VPIAQSVNTMCGIAGFVEFSGHQRDAAAARIKRMTDTIAHRGPDGEGYYVDDFAALGHRRLAIIDVAGGMQPMGLLDGSIQVVFNGEIYNFLELRTELESVGHRFNTRSDTEVILAAYLQWGDRCVKRLHGMFAFAIWDSRSKELFLARDRVGKKPIYYCRSGSVIAFASELKAICAGGLCRQEIDAEALDCYFCLGYIPAPRTIYREVRKLQAARTLTASASRQAEQHYWDLSFANVRMRKLSDAVDELECIFDSAVRQRLMSEVPLGAFLSGGLDSSLVVASMARCMDRPVITNSIGFEDADFNELVAARHIATHLSTNHQEFIVQPQVASVLEKIAWHLDEPLADSSALSTWYVCEMTRRNVTVALSGDGGDEGFGGYTFRYVPHLLESQIRALLPAWLRAPLFGALGRAWPNSAKLPKPMRVKSIFENLAVGNAEAFYRDLVWLRHDTRQRIFAPDFMDGLKGFTPAETVQPTYSRSDTSDALARSQFTDIHVYMTDDVLVKVDRMSMAHGLEVRSPLLDHRILEFAATLPSHIKLNGGKGKLPLRVLAQRRLPMQIVGLPKRGFSIPAARWLRSDLNAMAESLIFGNNAMSQSVLSKTEVRGLWREHMSGAKDHHVFLWGLMMLELWEKTRRTTARVSY